MAHTWSEAIIEDNKFKYTYIADQAQTSGYTLKLATENKFVDKDIWAKIIIGAGALSAGSGNVGLTNHGATGLLGTATSTQPSSGHYLEITGNGYVKVSTAGWLAAHTNSQDGVQSNTDTKYYPIQSAVFGFGTGSNANKLYCTTSGYVAANSTDPIDSITAQTPTTSYSHSNTMGTYFISGSSTDYDVIITPQYSNSAGYVSKHTDTNNGGIGYWKIRNATITEGTTTVTGSAGNYTATRGAMSVSSDGWISSSTIFPTASFRNTPADGTTASNYADISETSEAPILVTGDYLYITKGYTDNIKISLAKLVPDADQITGGKTFASASYILTGYAAWNEAGEQITGSMPTLTLPNSNTVSTVTGYTLKETLNTSTSNRYIKIGTGYNATAQYYLIRAVTTSGINAENIKYGTTIKVGDSNSATRIKNVAGTFTQTNTATSTNGAVNYTDGISSQILSGYSAWVDGIEITGNIATITLPTGSFPSSSTSGYTTKATLNVSTTNRYIKINKGYNSANAQYFIRAVTTSGISAANIKYNAVIKVGDANDDDRITGTTGTFTKASTVSSGQLAATYDTNKNSPQILSGYSAWVDGYELKGSIEINNSTNLTFNGATRTFTAPAGFYAADATKQIAAATLSAENGSVALTYDTGTLSIYKSDSNTGGVTINDNAPASDSDKVYIKVTGNGSVSNTIGWLNTATTTSSNDEVRYIILNKYDGSFSTG